MKKARNIKGIPMPFLQMEPRQRKDIAVVINKES
jgi:hypothetical protein